VRAARAESGPDRKIDVEEMVHVRIAVVYESVFGNTHVVADAIAEGVREAQPGATVELIRVGEPDAHRVEEVDLLIVGGPTHVRGMTTHRSRSMALQSDEQHRLGDEEHPGHSIEPGAEGPGVRDWFHGLPHAATVRFAAAFDTRAESWLAGGAAHGIAHRLRRHGYQLIAEPEGFHVQGMEGPLRDGERDRARVWGAAVTRRAATEQTALHTG
jgi:hypothetical protein